MKITTKMSLSLLTGEVLEHQFYEYAGPLDLLCGASSGQKQIGSEQSSTYQTMMNQAQQVFGNSSTVFNDLKNTFTPTIEAGPSQEGFSSAEKSNLQSQAITQSGQAYKNAKSAVGNATAAQGGGNNAALQSGVTTGINASVANSAAANTANELSDITEKDYATGRQNYDTAVAGLEGSTNVFNPASTMANSATSSGEAASNTENQISQQDNSWVQSVTGALGGIAGSVATGGMSNLGKGVGFFGG